MVGLQTVLARRAVSDRVVDTLSLECCLMTVISYSLDDIIFYL